MSSPNYEEKEHDTVNNNYELEKALMRRDWDAVVSTNECRYCRGTGKCDDDNECGFCDSDDSAQI